jgi:hypothetical protein
MIDGPMIKGFGIDGFKTNRFMNKGLRIQVGMIDSNIVERAMIE